MKLQDTGFASIQKSVQPFIKFIKVETWIIFYTYYLISYPTIVY